MGRYYQNQRLSILFGGGSSKSKPEWFCGQRPFTRMRKNLTVQEKGPRNERAALRRTTEIDFSLTRYDLTESARILN